MLGVAVAHTHQTLCAAYPALLGVCVTVKSTAAYKIGRGFLQVLATFDCRLGSTVQERVGVRASVRSGPLASRNVHLPRCEKGEKPMTSIRFLL